MTDYSKGTPEPVYPCKCPCGSTRCYSDGHGGYICAECLGVVEREKKK